MPVVRCENQIPPNRACNAPMVASMDAIGRVLWHCQRCAARAAGRCWQCGQRREKQGPKAAYCRRCKVRRELLNKRVTCLTPEQVARKRQYDQRYRDRPEYQPRNSAHKRAWMAAHPEKYPEYAEKARTRWQEKRRDPVWWEQEKARQRARYAARVAAQQASCLDKTRRTYRFSEAGQPPAQP
jgi:hypothetical protein